ncbi:MAG: MBL fold metallo-hydrolase [Alphaproteobacteria bacterium]|jgi:ribonuclease Z|nr:MBL fold metallo-hydrolase [Alphaproteobacteria bacterium]
MSNASSDRDGGTFRIVLLGTGSPRPSLARHHPAALVQWGRLGSMLVDAGDGVVGQLLAAGASLGEIEHVALTHMHWDHILGYPAFVWGSWNLGRQALSVIGPAGTAEMHERLVESYYREQAEWAIDLGFPRAGFDDIEVRDVAVGWSETVDGCRVAAGPVHHPPMEALAYRFSFGGRSLVVTGDTAMCDEIVAFSAGADVLVADACACMPAGEIVPARRRVLERLHEFHASPQQCVEIARMAEVPKVVLTHHLPEVEPVFDASNYAGEVIVGNDLDVIEI